jgi:dihydroorotase
MTLHSTNTRLIDPETLTDSPRSLTVEGGLIQSINAPSPRGAKIIACHGLPPTPGFASVQTSRVTA